MNDAIDEIANPDDEEEDNDDKKEEQIKIIHRYMLEAF